MSLKDLREMWTNAADHDRLKETEEYRKLMSYESGLNNDRKKVVAEWQSANRASGMLYRHQGYDSSHGQGQDWPGT